MAKVYRMPPNTNEREKIVGGLIDIVQMFWIAGGLFLAAIIIIVLYKFMGSVAIIIGFPFLFTGLPFAFIKKHNMPLAKYLKYKRRFKYATKHYINKGTNKEMDFVPAENEGGLV